MNIGKSVVGVKSNLKVIRMHKSIDGAQIFIGCESNIAILCPAYELQGVGIRHTSSAILKCNDSKEF